MSDRLYGKYSTCTTILYYTNGPINNVYLAPRLNLICYSERNNAQWKLLYVGNKKPKLFHIGAAKTETVRSISREEEKIANKNNDAFQ